MMGNTKHISPSAMQKLPFQILFKMAFALLLLEVSFRVSSFANENINNPGIMKKLFGTLPDGRKVNMFTLQNRNGMWTAPRWISENQCPSGKELNQGIVK
jgi:hypothetical protein